MASDLRECVSRVAFGRAGEPLRLWGFVGISVRWQAFCRAVRRRSGGEACSVRGRADAGRVNGLVDAVKVFRDGGLLVRAWR